jgi:hypothetical protein
MPITWQVKTHFLSSVPSSAIFDQWLEWTLTREVNGAGAYAFHINGDDPRVALFQQDDYQIEFWMTDPENGIAWRREFEGWHSDYDFYTDAAGARHFVSMGKGYIDLLDRTINESTAGSAGSAKAGQAETVIKAYVDEQAGPGAGARARFGLSIQADAATGNAVDLQRSYRNLLDVCRDVAAVGGGDFDIVSTTISTFQFRWYLGQRGTDRRATVVFSEGYGNMAEPRLEVRRSRVRNSAYVGGQGEGAAREIVLREDAASIALSFWGRREIFVDAREVDAGNVAALNDKGDAALAENLPTVAFNFKPVQSPGCLYGKHYFLGDLVTARYMGVDYARKIQSVTISHGRMGQSIDVQTVAI